MAMTACPDGSVEHAYPASRSRRGVDGSPQTGEDRAAFREECATWATPRYLRYGGERTALLDVTTMKLAYLFAPDAEPDGLMFNATLTYAVSTSPEGLRVAAIHLPP